MKEELKKPEVMAVFLGYLASALETKTTYKKDNRMKLRIFILKSFFTSLAFCDPSLSINSMKSEVDNFKNIIKDQNEVVDKIINLDKKIALDLRRAIFYSKQRNELIMNAWHIQGEKE